MLGELLEMCTKCQYLLCKRARKGKQEEHKILTNYRQKVNEMFVSARKQSTHDFFNN